MLRRRSKGGLRLVSLLDARALDGALRALNALLTLGFFTLHLHLCCFLRFPLLDGRSVSLCELGGINRIVPAPLLLELFVDKTNSPASFLVDLLEDSKHFLLLTTIGQDFGCMSKRSNTHGCNTPVNSVSVVHSDIPQGKLTDL